MKAGGRDYGLGGEQVEGHHAVHELLVAGRRRARRIWVADAETRSEPVQRITQLANERRVPVQIRPGEAVLATARTGAPQGVIAWADPVLAVELDELLEISALTGPPFMLVLDGVTDPGNFGSLLRTAACAGVGGVVVGRHRSAPLTPAAVKAAAGAVEHVPIASVGGVPAALQRLNRSGVWLVGLDPFGADELWSATLFDGPVALVLGVRRQGALAPRSRTVPLPCADTSTGTSRLAQRGCRCRCGLFRGGPPASRRPPLTACLRAGSLLGALLRRGCRLLLLLALGVEELEEKSRQSPTDQRGNDEHP